MRCKVNRSYPGMNENVIYQAFFFLYLEFERERGTRFTCPQQVQKRKKNILGSLTTLSKLSPHLIIHGPMVLKRYFISLQEQIVKC